MKMQDLINQLLALVASGDATLGDDVIFVPSLSDNDADDAVDINHMEVSENGVVLATTS